MQITKTTLRRIIKEELDAVTKEGVLDDIVGRKPSGAPMTAQARQDILDGYVAFVQDKMPNVSPEDAVKSAIDLFVAGGDPYLDPQSDLFDQDLLDSLMSGAQPPAEEAVMNEVTSEDPIDTLSFYNKMQETDSAVYYNKLQRADKYKYFKAAIASLWRTGVKSKEALDALDTTKFAGLLPPRARQAR